MKFTRSSMLSILTAPPLLALLICFQATMSGGCGSDPTHQQTHSIRPKDTTSCKAQSEPATRPTDIFSSFDRFPVSGFDSNTIQGRPQPGNSMAPFMLSSHKLYYDYYRDFLHNECANELRRRIFSDSAIINRNYSSAMLLMVLGSIGYRPPLLSVAFYNDTSGVVYWMVFDTVIVHKQRTGRQFARLADSVLRLGAGSVEEVGSDAVNRAMLALSSPTRHFNMIAGPVVVFAHYPGYDSQEFEPFRIKIPRPTFLQRLYVDSLILTANSFSGFGW